MSFELSELRRVLWLLPFAVAGCGDAAARSTTPVTEPVTGGASTAGSTSVAGTSSDAPPTAGGSAGAGPGTGAAGVPQGGVVTGGAGAGGAAGSGGTFDQGGGAGASAEPRVRAGCESVTFEGHLYALCRDAKVPFPEARKDCESMSLQLIRLDSAAESDWIYATFYAQPTAAGPDSAQMWAGASDRLVEGEWRWSIGGDIFWRGEADGAAVDGHYAYWGRAHGVGEQDQPNDAHSDEGEDCMVIRAPSEQEAGHWTDIGCGAENAPAVPSPRLGWYTCESE